MRKSKGYQAMGEVILVCGEDGFPIPESDPNDTGSIVKGNCKDE